MFVVRLTAAAVLTAALLWPATFGTVVPLVGGAADLVLDEGRGRLYLVNTTQSRVEVYAIARRTFLNPVPVDSTPLSAAISRDGASLYVASYDASALNVIDLESLAVKRVSLPAKPEGVAVGSDGRVLISTIGTGTAAALSNVLLLYNPAAQDTNALMT